MKYLEIHYLDIKERKELEEKGLYCYDLRHSDFGGKIACIEKDVLVNRVGSIVTDKEIPLGNKYPNDYKDYEEFIKENESVSMIEELLSSKLQEEMKEMLDNNNEFKDYKLECIMIDNDNIEKSYGILINDEEIAFIEMYKKDINKITDAELTFNLGEDNIFESLENNMKIGYMSMGVHHGLWLEVSHYYPEDTKHKNGVQKYLKYCRENHITKENIDKTFIDTSPYENVPDIMKYYNGEKEKCNKNIDIR